MDPEQLRQCLVVERETRHYRDLYRRRAYLGATESTPVRRQVSALARAMGVADRRENPVEPEQQPEQLVLAV
jgi:hypothetical protein